MESNILMVEDDSSVAEMMELLFRKKQWNVDIVRDGLEAVDKLKERPDYYDMITLDLNLPKKDGIQAAKEVRAIFESVPIIMFTARDSESDQVLGLEIGADNYVTKPFSPIALIARIKALHRRAALENNNEGRKAKGGFDIATNTSKISKVRHEVCFSDKQIDGLTPKEPDLFYTMAQKPKQAFSRDKLFELVWGYEYYGEERTAGVHIKRLRQKLEEVGLQVIRTVWRVGYELDDSQVNK